MSVIEIKDLYKIYDGSHVEVRAVNSRLLSGPPAPGRQLS